MSVIGQKMRAAFRRAGTGEGGARIHDLTTRQALVAPSLLEVLENAPTPSEQVINADAWLVYYKGDVQPDAETVPWTETLSGTVTHTTDGSRFTITDDSDDEHLYYYITQATLDATVGAVLEAKTLITSSSTAINRGSALSIFDGSKQYTAWLRSGGFNIDGEVEVAMSMGVWRRVKLVAKDNGCQLWIDGNIRQVGSWMNTTSKTQFTFGSYVKA